MKFFTIFIVIFIVFGLLMLGGIQLDLFLNPWLRHAVEEWGWYNYFTSHHSATALYITGSKLWLIIPAIVSMIASFSITASLKK